LENFLVQGAALEFTRVLKSKRQVVTGTLHDLILEAADAGKKSLYRAKVWVKPWEDFKSVVEFRLVGDSESESESSVTSDVSSGQGIVGIQCLDNIYLLLIIQHDLPGLINKHGFLLFSAIAKLSLEADIAQEEAHLHTIENDGLSGDFASSS
jgi:hypothetical protein